MSDVHSYTEHRLVRVRGTERLVFARGSRRYVEDMFMLHAPHTPPVALAAQFGKQPTAWFIEEVDVTETLVSAHAKSAAQVEEARRAAANNIPPEVRTADERAQAGEH